MQRSTNLDRLRTEEFDILIIGGGASGAGCALDSVLRGYQTALIEKQDFAAETSSKSTKLIHGGVRYLERAFKQLDLAQLKQVRHGLEERHNVLRNAPHLARPLALITPVFSWLEGLYFTIGLTIYGWFASGQDQLPGSKWLSKKETISRLPGLSRRIHSAVLYYDGQLDDARYGLALAQSAHEAGAAVANHCSLIGFESDTNGKLQAAIVRDELSGEEFRIKSKVFINCTGPFADYVRQLANPNLSKRMRPSKGVHAMLPKELLAGDDALLIPETSDGRVVFAIPFQGKLMLGTTDDDYSKLDQEPLLDHREVHFLLETLNRYLDKPAQPKQLVAGFGGLRPLIAADPAKGTKGLVRDHEVEHDPASGLVSLLGGKWTTYRLMARDTIDFIAEELLPSDAASSTAQHYLVGGREFDPSYWKSIQEKTAWPEDICRHLNQHYGDRVDRIVSLTEQEPRLSQRIVEGYPFILAEIVYAVQSEMACTLRDFLARRIRLEILDWDGAQQAAGTVAREMGTLLGWTAREQESKAEAYIDLIYEFREQAG